jgi:hypothetical protein
LKDRYQLTSSRKQPRKDIKYIVLEMRKAYSTMPQGMQRDIDAAFTSAVWICESIIYYKNSIDIAKEAEGVIYSFLLEEASGM